MIRFPCLPSDTEALLRLAFEGEPRTAHRARMALAARGFRFRREGFALVAELGAAPRLAAVVILFPGVRHG